MVAFLNSKRKTNASVLPRKKIVSLATALAVLFFTNLHAIAMTTALRPLNSNILKRRLIWHRNRDLRFHDHPFYGKDYEAETTSIFVFDDAFGCGIQPSTCLPTQWKATHLGPHGMRVLLESVQDLRRISKKVSSQELIVRRGATIPVLLGILEELIQMDIETKDNNSISDIQNCEPFEYLYEVCWNEEPGFYEQELSEMFKKALTQKFETLASKWVKKNQTIRLSIQTDMSCTLYHPNDLPKSGEWQPLSKKEKRRRQKQQQRSSKNIKAKVDNTPSATISTESNDQKADNCVDISLDRWTGMPKIMGDFRKIAREKADIRECNRHQEEGEESMLPIARSHYTIDPGPIPSLEELLEPILRYIDNNNSTKQPILGLPDLLIRDVCRHSLEIHHHNLRSMENQPSFIGGETAGLKHLEYFVQSHAHTAQRSLACVDNHQSSRLSHYLAFGCLPPRKVVATVEASIALRKEQETQSTNENDGTWLISHMTMRDFFLYTCLASGKQFFRLEGIPVSQKVASAIRWKCPANNKELWKSWATGSTGLPLVDAAMAELLQTGYCSNRVRQNAASVLTKDLGLDWRAGAEWFQFLLQDHCVGANWGNWLYFSGVGPDPKNRHFCTVSQALKYDPQGEYVTKWIPSLRQSTIDEIIDEEYYLRPWDFDASWKRPIVDPESQYTWRDLEMLKETGHLLEEDYI